MVWLAETVTTVSVSTSPADSSPELLIEVATEFSVQVGETVCDVPSLKKAVAVNCPVLFSLMLEGPLMERKLNTGATLTTVTFFVADRVTPPWV